LEIHAEKREQAGEAALTDLDADMPDPALVGDLLYRLRILQLGNVDSDQSGTRRD
jgi:hypothetical protein